MNTGHNARSLLSEEEEDKVPRDRVSLRDAADILELEHVRLVRLAHYLHLAPRDEYIPSEVVMRASGEEDGERRYAMVLEWLLEHLAIGVR
jgi:hypothetical protein